jgi:hypothetical protein
MNWLSALRSEKKLVDVTGIEPVTPCLQRLVARRISNLHALRRNATDCYKLHQLIALRLKMDTP